MRAHGDLQRIHALVARVRRRIRVQHALEWGTTALVPALAGALVVFWLWRMSFLTPRGAILAVAGVGLAWVAAVLVAALMPVRTDRVAHAIDRASGLSDRLSTALDFAARMKTGEDRIHAPETRALMGIAVDDGIQAVARAKVEASAPFRWPRDLRAAGGAVVVAFLVVLLRFPLGAQAGDGDGALVRRATPPEAPAKDALDPDDLGFQRQFVEDMKQLAEQTQDQQLLELAQQLKDLLDKAEKGDISKQELIAKMDEAERKYMDGSHDDVDKALADMKDQGKELKKNPVTKRLGEALEQGDMQAAAKELERLADQIDKGDMKPEDQKKLEEALEKAAEKQDAKEQKDKQEQQQAQKEIEKKKDEVRQLQKKLEKEPKNEEAQRTLQKKQRELDKLERNQKDKQEQQSKRQLDRLSRHLKKSAENLKQKQQKEAAQNLRQGAKGAQKVEEEMKKLSNQKKVQSQMGDLKEAIRRAKPKKNGQGNGQQQARAQRIKEWEGRASGQRGQKGQQPGQGQPGQGQPGQQPGQEHQGGQLGGKEWGDEHDENLMGDPTQLSSKKIDEQLSGVQGKGPSRRETILTSAKKGFASTGYKKVYAEYQKVIEEIMNQEKVPQGYKYYVKRYFQRIKPHDMN